VSQIQPRLNTANSLTRLGSFSARLIFQPDPLNRQAGHFGLIGASPYHRRFHEDEAS
jgi:hypothetical protein